MNKLYNKVAPEELKKLKKSFPEVNRLLEIGESNNLYSSLAVSTFDHWLSRDEAEVLFDISEEEQLQRNEDHFEFCKLLFKNTEVYDLRYKKRRNKEHHIFRKFTNFESFEKRVDNDSWFHGFSFYILALPKYEAIYHQNYDDTQILYYRDRDKLTEFMELVKKANIHILEMKK